MLSWLGKISVIKMNALSKINFLFQMFPIKIPNKTLKNWENQINAFIWNGRRPRIKFKVLQGEKKRGRLAVPNIKLYFQPGGMVWISEWIKIPHERLIKLEEADLVENLHSHL